MPRRAWESRPSIALPTPPVRPSPPLCDAVRHDQQQPRGTVPPTPVRLTRCTLEKGRRSPRRGDERLLHARTGLHRDVRPVGAVTSVAIGPVRPSPPSRRHPGHCITIPDAVEVCGDRTPPRRLLCLVLPHVNGTLESSRERPSNRRPLCRHPRSCSWTRHDAPPEARFARTVIYSMALYAMPPHIDKTVWKRCKLPPPWPIKGGSPLAARGRRTAHTYTLSAFTTILALASISTSGTWRTSVLSRLTCSSPLQPPWCNAI
jgi:hypothetical protein